MTPIHIPDLPIPIPEQIRIEDELRAAFAARGYPSPDVCEADFDGHIHVRWNKDGSAEVADEDALLELARRLVPQAESHIDDFTWALNLRFGMLDRLDDIKETNARREKDSTLSEGEAIYIITDGWYSDYHIVDVVVGPPGLDLKPDWEAFRDQFVQSRYSRNFSVVWDIFAAKRPELRSVKASFLHLGGD